MDQTMMKHEEIWWIHCCLNDLSQIFWGSHCAKLSAGAGAGTAGAGAWKLCIARLIFCDYAELKLITLYYTTLHYTILYFFFCWQGTRKKSAGSEPNIKQK